MYVSKLKASWTIGSLTTIGLRFIVVQKMNLVFSYMFRVWVGRVFFLRDFGLFSPLLPSPPPLLRLCNIHVIYIVTLLLLGKGDHRK